jgi:hypothetical protein
MPLPHPRCWCCGSPTRRLRRSFPVPRSSVSRFSPERERERERERDDAFKSPDGASRRLRRYGHPPYWGDCAARARTSTTRMVSSKPKTACFALLTRRSRRSAGWHLRGVDNQSLADTKGWYLVAINGSRHRLSYSAVACSKNGESHRFGEKWLGRLEVSGIKSLHSKDAMRFGNEFHGWKSQEV